MTGSNESSPHRRSGARVEPDPGEELTEPLEREWLAGIRRGDRSAFTHAFHAYYNRLCTYAVRYVGSAEVAEELVEDLFFWIWQQRERLEVRGRLKPYLYTAVRNRSLKHLRSERVRARAHAGAAQAEYSPAMGRSACAADEELNASELAAIVRATLDALPERPREAFLLARQHGLSHAEIARVMDIAVSTVEKHVVRAMRTLRQAVEDWYAG